MPSLLPAILLFPAISGRIFTFCGSFFRNHWPEGTDELQEEVTQMPKSPIPARLSSVSQPALKASQDFPTTKYVMEEEKTHLGYQSFWQDLRQSTNMENIKAPSSDTLQGQWWRKILPVGRNAGSPPGHLPERTKTEAGLAATPAKSPLGQRPARSPQPCTTQLEDHPAN